ncbi:MAG: peptide chain release factor 2 [Candidatus Portnoybacteria bacterium CG03_land_8_20_14_0_80_41_10]|uniref:Peptide chain release factor 2 n=1 Tax=Candidatus Portnoybacteria bacterium CG03_land_8_20_14_0_80_41_10 TaxID=1974808 RepID=A0A2M7BTY9_9BACT|nr:MAG: peptide chain release factor 2 [Candidatus Portnoybacteria bacterium CG03_land_8_20_14_0_80_41_10]
MKDLTEKLKGKYDRRNAILSIYAGAGGVDAQDWAEMLLRMYLKCCQNQKWPAQVLQIKEGKEAGLKNVTLLVEKNYAYGYLKGEGGVHRLVRLSPFNADHLRQTSFALVEILPELTEIKEINIRPEDLKIDTYRASGPGGQYVNKTESAIRITHLPTGLVAACQSERLQGENKKKAMKLLYSKLHQHLLKNKEKEKKELKDQSLAIEWGSQIRSYVLHPYKMVKDHRTGVKSSEPEKVLDGKLDKFIEGFIQAEKGLSLK